jgi:hypothetical protein
MDKIVTSQKFLVNFSQKADLSAAFLKAMLSAPFAGMEIEIIDITDQDDKQPERRGPGRPPKE